MLEAASGVNRDGKPFVALTWGTESGQLTPDETRQMALTLLEVAEAAEMEATVFDWLGTLVGDKRESLPQRAQILASFRQHRQQARQRGERSVEEE
jgi:hypothetical protein